MDDFKQCICGHEMTKQDWYNRWCCYRCGRTQQIEEAKTNFERIKEMDVDEFVEELFLNIPDEQGLQFMFGSWMNKEDVKEWLEMVV